MADQSPLDPDEVVRRIAEAGKGIRLGKGVVAKTGHAQIALLAMWGVVVWRLTENLLADLALLSAGIIGTAAFIWWTWATQRFAERNPAQAMLEGAEFLEYKRFEAQAKGFSSDLTMLEDKSAPLVI